MLTNQMMDVFATGTLQAIDRSSLPSLTAQDYRMAILDDIRNAQDNNNIILGRARLKVSDIRGYMDGVALKIAELEAELQNTKAEMALQEQWMKQNIRDWKDPHTPAPVETVTEVTVEPEWITISAYAKRHGKAYSTVAGKKNDLITRQDPTHAGRWQIDASSPYPRRNQ